MINGIISENVYINSTQASRLLIDNSIPHSGGDYYNDSQQSLKLLLYSYYYYTLDTCETVRDLGENFSPLLQKEPRTGVRNETDDHLFRQPKNVFKA